MVFYELVEESTEELLYAYYPEKKEAAEPGYILIDRIQEQINIVRVAEEDYFVRLTSEDINASYAAWNQMRREEGLEDLVWEELPAGEDHSYFMYASKVISKIADAYNEGRVEREGCVAWY